jgi:hypothetical protein
MHPLRIAFPGAVATTIAPVIASAAAKINSLLNFGIQTARTIKTPTCITANVSENPEFNKTRIDITTMFLRVKK